MRELAIKVQGLSKEYSIGLNKSGSFREGFSRRIKHLMGEKVEGESFMALRDISFEVKIGEAVGIIGRNGAGKSTLLKILSRITEPTKGRIEINGRVSSLLEVGTGFHPELTGRENIYLNGTILGMTRREVKSKFDEIVEFSGVNKFIDTPVKHYSSGMKVRLAFSVAAHLEPEILIIDEVLAVGDSAFQKKCIEKMTDISKEGITIIFVSHNMQAVKNMCNSAMVIDTGQIKKIGTTNDAIKYYLERTEIISDTKIDLLEIKRSKWAQGIKFKTIYFDKKVYFPGDKIEIILKLQSDGKKYNDLLFGLNIMDNMGNCLVHLSNIFINKIKVNYSDQNKYKFILSYVNLKPGKYFISLFLRANEEIQDWISDVAAFNIEEGNIYGFENSKMITGLIQPDFEFEEI